MLAPVTRVALIVCACLALAACGPAGPNESKGPPARPTYVLHTLPVPSGLRDGVAERTATPAEVLTALLPQPPVEAEVRRATGAGLGESAIRTFTAPGGGRMAAVVTVWPSNLVAANFARQVVQMRLDAGGSAWTPKDVPGGQGARLDGGRRERILVKAVGPNTLFVVASGPVPDDAVEVTVRRMVEVQEAQG